MTGQQWTLAVTRAQQLASAAMAVTDNNWEYTGTRNVLAIALAALGRQSAGGVEAVTLGSLLWHLSRLDGGVRQLAIPLVGEELALATDTDPATVDDSSDPVLAAWLWLTRTWPADPHQPLSKDRWDGMTRGLARDSAEPAVVVCRGLAVDAVCHALEEELHGPLAAGTEVQGVGGEADGATGTVIAPAWFFDDERRDLSGGPLPHGYEVQLAEPAADNTVIWRTAALQVVLDEQAWEEMHRSAYGLDAWTRAERQAWVLTQRHIGYHADDLDLYASGASSTPEAVSEREDTWLPANRLLALAVWRAARREGRLVDDVDLTHPLWWLGGALHERLFADPLPAWDPAPVLGSWQELREREDELRDAARGIATWHQLRDLHDNRALRDTQDTASLQPPPLLLGDSCRDLKSGPFRDGQPPRWQSAVEYATKAVADAIDKLHAGEWTPHTQARQAAAELLPTLQAPPDSPELPAHIGGPAWIQRAVRIGHLQATLRTVQDHHRGEAELDVQSAPLGLALGLVWNALDDSAPALSGLEELWAQRQHDVARWERTHLPLALRAYIRALEELTSTLGTLCFDLYTGHSTR
ncbi:hypothetical protein [Streptomyces sp. NPDC001492]